MLNNSEKIAQTLAHQKPRKTCPFLFGVHNVSQSRKFDLFLCKMSLPRIRRALNDMPLETMIKGHKESWHILPHAIPSSSFHTCCAVPRKDWHLKLTGEKVFSGTRMKIKDGTNTFYETENFGEDENLERVLLDLTLVGCKIVSSFQNILTDT